MLKEIWKDVKGFEGKYQVSSIGRVRSLDRITTDHLGRSYFTKGRIMKLILIKGYHYVGLSERVTKNFQVHRLVAFAFLGIDQSRTTVNHINGIKNDNRVENLEWANYSEQIIHCVKTGLRPKSVGEKSNLAKLSQETIYKIRKEYKTGFFTMKELALRHGTSMGNISNIVHCYTWKFLKEERLLGIKSKMPHKRFKLNLHELPAIWHLFYVSKMTYVEIGNIFEYNRGTITRVIKEKDKYLTYYNNAEYKQSI